MNVGAHGETKEREQDVARDKRKLILLWKRKNLSLFTKAETIKAYIRKH